MSTISTISTVYSGNQVPGEDLPKGVGIDDLEVRVWDDARSNWFPYEASAEE